MGALRFVFLLFVPGFQCRVATSIPAGTGCAAWVTVRNTWASYSCLIRVLVFCIKNLRQRAAGRHIVTLDAVILRCIMSVLILEQ